LTVTGPAFIPEAVQVIRGRRWIAAELGRRLRAPAVAIGNFDGVHRGHQALLALTAARAQAAGGEAVALTFDPHPARLLAPALAPPMLLSLPRRLELLGQAGAQVVIVEPFDMELAAMSAEDFVTQVLHCDIGVRAVVVGHDFSFGAGRTGDVSLLAAVGRRLGMDVDALAPVKVDGMVCSSTKIREFVLEGRMEGARLLLGRPFELEGLVVRGAGRGRGIGVPTANLEPVADIVPGTGIYAAWAQVDRPGAEPLRLRAAVSIGSNPTFAGDGPSAPIVIEAHLLDFGGLPEPSRDASRPAEPGDSARVFLGNPEGVPEPSRDASRPAEPGDSARGFASDLYGARVRLEFVTRLRGQRRFATAGELVAEIARDVARVREILA
jgi:riboflavin kinase/FMN adenylyltransferase